MTRRRRRVEAQVRGGELHQSGETRSDRAGVVEGLSGESAVGDGVRTGTTLIADRQVTALTCGFPEPLNVETEKAGRRREAISGTITGR